MPKRQRNLPADKPDRARDAHEYGSAMWVRRTQKYHPEVDVLKLAEAYLFDHEHNATYEALAATFQVSVSKVAKLAVRNGWPWIRRRMRMHIEAHRQKLRRELLEEAKALLKGRPGSKYLVEALMFQHDYEWWDKELLTFREEIQRQRKAAKTPNELAKVLANYEKLMKLEAMLGKNREDIARGAGQAVDREEEQEVERLQQLVDQKLPAVAAEPLYGDDLEKRIGFDPKPDPSKIVREYGPPDEEAKARMTNFKG